MNMLSDSETQSLRDFYWKYSVVDFTVSLATLEHLPRTPISISEPILQKIWMDAILLEQ
jgi:hypothetical protein